MHTTFTRILAIGGGLAVLLFIATLITFGGPNTVTLSDQIRSNASLVPPEISQTNLTDVLTDELAKEIVEKNPEGPAANGGLGIIPPNPNELVAQVIEEQLQSFDVDAVWPYITEDQITVLSPATTDNRRLYFKAYFDILGKRLLTNYLTSSPPTPAQLMMVSTAYKETMADLAAVSTPDDFVEMHIQTLELLGAQANIFEIISQYEQDPLKAYLANLLREDITQEASELREKMVSYIEEHPVVF